MISTNMAPKIVIIPCAGMGTRFLPATAAISKEMIPVLGRPLVDFVLEEGLEAQCDTFIFILSPHKTDLKSYLEIKKKEYPNLHFIFLYQEHPKGLGDAILQANTIMSEKFYHQYFYVTLPDDLLIGQEKGLSQLKKSFLKQVNPYSFIGVLEVPQEEVSAYGVIAPKEPLAINKKHRPFDLIEMQGMVEKPSPKEAPSLLATPGRYLFSPSIFAQLQKVIPDAKGEIQLTAAINSLAKKEHVYSHYLDGKRLDCGTPLAHLKSSLIMALNDQHFAPLLKEFIQQLSLLSCLYLLPLFFFSLFSCKSFAYLPTSQELLRSHQNPLKTINCENTCIVKIIEQKKIPTQKTNETTEEIHLLTKKISLHQNWPTHLKNDVKKLLFLFFMQNGTLFFDTLQKEFPSLQNNDNAQIKNNAKWHLLEKIKHSLRQKTPSPLSSNSYQERKAIINLMRERAFAQDPFVSIIFEEGLFYKIGFSFLELYFEDKTHQLQKIRVFDSAHSSPDLILEIKAVKGPPDTFELLIQDYLKKKFFKLFFGPNIGPVPYVNFGTENKGSLEYFQEIL